MMKRQEKGSTRNGGSSRILDDEEAFWMAGAEGKDSDTVDTDSDSETTTSFLSRRVQKSSTMGSAPVSPPPSHRRPPGAKIVSAPALELLPVVEENPSPSETSPPETPKRSRTNAAMRDSPNNPFLASPLDLDDVDVLPRTPKETPKERPTITYVFRGVKKTYPNPYYDHENDRPRSPDPNSLLPIEHEDYVPDLRGAPRALWPKRRKGPAPLSTPQSPTRAHRRKATVQLVDSDDELDGKSDDDEEVSLRPVRLFGLGGRPGVAARSS
ncbi:hypothetical protein BT96DRAFT_353859 [Gymnopus androsaceus JB14]|uniref:Uncharacterized protein n=1 Tax=Gymnopus androsaceus JB14 TaxID=1447944 RepID=A0A6A4GW93_9AGAR|nr:hypothetical protein BT96DRAFT_353859 [Gymnopus androsaceus JB14]